MRENRMPFSHALSAAQIGSEGAWLIVSDR